MGYTKRKGGGKAPKATKNRRASAQRKGIKIKEPRATKKRRAARQRRRGQLSSAAKKVREVAGPYVDTLTSEAKEIYRSISEAVYKRYQGISEEDKPIGELAQAVCNLINKLSNLSKEDFHDIFTRRETKELIGHVHHNLRLMDMHEKTIANNPSEFIKENKKYLKKYPIFGLTINQLTHKLNSFSVALAGEYRDWEEEGVLEDPTIKAFTEAVNNGLLNGSYLDRGGEGVDYYKDWISKLFK